MKIVKLNKTHKLFRAGYTIAIRYDLEEVPRIFERVSSDPSDVLNYIRVITWLQKNCKGGHPLCSFLPPDEWAIWEPPKKAVHPSSGIFSSYIQPTWIGIRDEEILTMMLLSMGVA